MGRGDEVAEICNIKKLIHAGELDMSIEAPYEKAAEEGAKTIQKMIGAGEKAGSYLSRTFGSTIEELADWSHEVVVTKRNAWRRNNFGAIMGEVYNKRPQQIEHIKQIPERLQSRVIESVSNEDNDEIRKLWIELLRRVTDANFKYDLEKLHLRILEEIEPVEVFIFRAISDFFYTRPPDVYVLTGDKLVENSPISENDLDKYLHHLASLGCFMASDGSTGFAPESYEREISIITKPGEYTPTPLLRSFLESVGMMQVASSI